MLLSKDAIADVVEVLRPGDFYRPAHQAVYDCVLDLYGRGEPADPITVSAELERRGELGRVGGAPYLHTLIAIVPTAANASYYAEIVAGKAVLRRLIEAGTRIVQLGYHGVEGADVDTVVDRAQMTIYDATERRMSEDYIALEELLQPTMDEIDAIASHGGVASGVPTGFTDLDAVTNGLHPGQMVVVAARPGLGKALALDTALPTPDGWTTMGEVAVGDQLLDASGHATTVIAATGVMTERSCFEVEFSDGSVIVADAQHQWLTETQPSHCSPWAGSEVRTTEELAARTGHLAAGYHCNHVAADHCVKYSVRTCLPLDLPVRELLVPPYSLGVWLGCGDSSGRSADPEVAMPVEADDHGHPPAVRTAGGRAALRALGLLGDEHIPMMYQRACEAQRRALLAGLLDTTGTVTGSGEVHLPVINSRLARDVRELVVSLGYPCRADPNQATAPKQARDPSQPLDVNLITFATNNDVFRLERKRLVHQKRRHFSPFRPGHRYITNVRPVPAVPVRCVQVDNTEHLYLAGRSMIPTHNSTLGLDWARSCSVRHGMPSVVFSLEMSRTEIVMRLLSAEARIRLFDMRSGRMSDEDWTRLARRMGEISEAPLFIDDSPNMTMMEIRAKARRLKQRHDLKLIVLDYLQLMTSGKRVESRQQEVSEFSRQLKLLAKELEVPLVAISQLNRSPEQRTDKKPMLADLRESGCLTANTRLLRADTGAETSLGELVASGETGIPLWSLDERIRMVPRPMSSAFPSGVKEVFRLRLASGRAVEATASHPFLTPHGWCALGDLALGDRVASPRRVPPPLSPALMPDEHIVLLAHLIGGSSFVHHQPLRYTSTNETNIAAVTEAALAFGVTALRDKNSTSGCITVQLSAPYHPTCEQRNPIAVWLDEFGLSGHGSHEKFVPSTVFSLPDHQLALFLRHLWAATGSVYGNERAHSGHIYYTSASHRLMEDVSRLLLRFGVLTQLVRINRAGYRNYWHLKVYDVESQLAFLRKIGVHRLRGALADGVDERLSDIAGRVNLDTIPREVWIKVQAFLAAKQMVPQWCASETSLRSRESRIWKNAPSHALLATVAAVLLDAELEMLATNDIFWDKIVKVESMGEQVVYDATVPGTHNFVANGIVVHNSIEQDADMVVLLHRPDAFERDDPRAGEADLILAKHRNGPTATITVAHQLHYSRFVDMARG
ncbi:MAG: replicative DNA helicase [Actinomycetota bacterium]|nr:replicative DNA helicase [Actinomycetota bacterium]